MGFKVELHKELSQIQTREDGALGIMRWGLNNSFPQTLKNLIEQSANAKPAISRTAKFYKGQGFEGENEIVNPYGLTLKRVVDIMAEDYAIFEAFAIQCNYNLKGEVTSINPMRISELRFNVFDELNYASKIGYHKNFALNSEVKKNVQSIPNSGSIKWFDRFNPNVVEEQISKTKGGIGNYLGQMLYYSESGYSSYPIPPLQSAINFVLSDVENSILVRKETSTGFVDSYILKTSMDSEDATLIALEDKIIEAQGARGTGKIITFAGLAPEELSATILEKIGGGTNSNIIDSARKTYELDKEVITSAYLIPPALAGVDQKSGFSGADLKEAYTVFNAITQGGREVIENELNRILRHSIFNTRDIKIKKLALDLDEDQKNAMWKDNK